MSDVNMGKIKELYGDMVAIEQNVASIENRLSKKLAEFEAKIKIPTKLVQQKAPGDSLRTIIMVAASSLCAGLVLRPGQPISYLVAGLPFGMAIAWFVFDYLKSDEIAKINKVRVNSTPKQESIKVWTEDEFISVSSSINPSYSNRTLSACMDVLVNKIEVNEAAKQHDVQTFAITKCLYVLRRNKKE